MARLTYETDMRSVTIEVEDESVEVLGDFMQLCVDMAMAHNWMPGSMKEAMGGVNEWIDCVEKEDR